MNMSDDTFMNELPIPAESSSTGIDQLDRVQALEAQVLALQALVQMLLERDIENSDQSAEAYVNLETSSIFGRMMSSPIYQADDEGVARGAEALATNLIEALGRAKQAREAN